MGLTEIKRPHFGPPCPSSPCDSGRGLNTVEKQGGMNRCAPSPGPRGCRSEATYLVAAGHNDVLWLRHDTALLGHQRVLGVAGEPVGGEEPIVLLHTERLP